MARIGLTSGFSLIPEGTHVFQIIGVNYKEAFGKLEITMRTQSGQKHTERYSLLKSDGSPNDGALGAFSYMAKTALKDYERADVDPEELVGCYLECDVEHEVLPKRDGKEGETVTFVRLADKRTSDGWAASSAPQAAATQAAPVAQAEKAQTTPTGGFDLTTLLGLK